MTGPSILINTFLVAAGGLIGAICRYIVSRWIQQRVDSSFPWGTMLVNITGSFLLGFLLRESMSNSLFLLFGTGFLGAYTTFSTFKLENVQMMRRRETKKSALYLFGSYSLGISAAFLGYAVAL